MKLTIEDKLRSMPLSVRDEFSRGMHEMINAQKLSPRFYMSSRFPGRIVKYFRYNELLLDGWRTPYPAFEEEIRRNLDHSVLSKVFFGAYVPENGRTVPRELPRSVLKAFCDEDGWGKWALIYMFNGICQNAFTAPVDCQKGMYGLSLQLIKKGMAGMVHDHNHHSEAEIYRDEKQLPHGKEIYYNLPELHSMKDLSFNPEVAVDEGLWPPSPFQV